uniref:FAS1 domain-containing protein n=1 Tax=Nelumbo nucifera TaxID=4432 RepID=A0A822Y6R3_NELNU|nr:TPA_asm: hypothetical protein HUJ06_029668 [Nelumbo nucifera]
MASVEEKAPTPNPSELNLTSLMSKQGCKTFDNNIEGGLTVLCPTDQVFKDFMPKYKNLITDGNNLLLLYHGIPVYDSMEMLRLNNGVVNTLAIDGANNMIPQFRTTANQHPLAIYTIDKVLLPKELFKAWPMPVPTLAPTPMPMVGKSPKAPKHVSPPISESVSWNGELSDQTVADDNNVVRFNGER